MIVRMREINELDHVRQHRYYTDIGHISILGTLHFHQLHLPPLSAIAHPDQIVQQGEGGQLFLNILKNKTPQLTMITGPVNSGKLALIYAPCS